MEYCTEYQQEAGNTNVSAQISDETWICWARVFCGMRIAECGKLSRGNLWKIKCGTFRKLPIIALPHSAAEKFRISTDRKTTIRSRCTTDVQLVHSSVRRPAVLSFRIHCGPFAKEKGSCFTVSTNFKVSSTFQMSCHFASRCDWFQFL